MAAAKTKELNVDSGVASPEASDGLSSEEEKKSTEPDKSSSKKEMAVSKVNQDEIEDDDSDIDETLSERLLGLTEMFPDSLRNATSKLSRGVIYLLKNGYELTRQGVWLGVSTSIVLFAPVMLEIERFNVEEMVKQDRNRLVLGPGSALSGPPGSAGMPPPPAR